MLWQLLLLARIFRFGEGLEKPCSDRGRHFKSKQLKSCALVVDEKISRGDAPFGFSGRIARLVFMECRIKLCQDFPTLSNNFRGHDSRYLYKRLILLG